MIDTHFHSAVMRNKGMDPPALLEKAFSDGILDWAVDIGTRPGDINGRVKDVGASKHVLFASGIYPAMAVGELTPLIDELKDNIDAYRKRIVAVGECGIDLYWDYGPVETQQELLTLQIELANEYSLPVVIHNREADKAVLQVLQECPPKMGGVMHCYSSGTEHLSSFLDLGMYISFAGNLTFKNAGPLREAAEQVPLDRVVFETDSPYLTPVPHRGKVNHPALVENTYRFFAELRKVNIGDLIVQVDLNGKSLFRINPGQF